MAENAQSLHVVLQESQAFRIQITLPACFYALRADSSSPAAPSRCFRGSSGRHPPLRRSLFFRPARVFDGDAMHEGWAVRVQGDRIEAAGPAASVAGRRTRKCRPAGHDAAARARSKGTRTCCCIPTTRPAWNDQVLHESLGVRTARAVNHLRATLMAGFTTIRDLGTEGAGYADAELKQAVEQGIIPGPRMLVTTRAIVATGSYGPKGFRSSGACRRAPKKPTATRSFASSAIRSATAPTGSRSMPTIAGARAAKRAPTFSLEELKTDRRDGPEQRTSGRCAREHRRRACGARSWPASRPSSTATAARPRSSS